MTTSSRNRIDVDENCSDFSDSYSSDDDSHLEARPQTTTIQHRHSKVLADNSALLWDLSGHISTVWKQVGRNVGIKECIIENIEIDYESDDAREKAYQLLLMWTRALGSKVTLHTLVNTLVYMGRNDIANAVSVSNRQQRRFSVGSERAAKSHAKLQKQALRTLKKALQFYQQRLGEMEDLQHRAFEEKEAQEMKAKLQELDKNIIQRKLDSLQEQICSIQGNEQNISELDQQLRIVADKLYELDKTFKNFNDTLDDLRFSYYSKIECVFGSLCYFRHIKFPRSSSSGKRSPSKGDEEIDDEVFLDSPCQDPREHSESKTSPKPTFTRNTQRRSSFQRCSNRPRNKTRFQRGQEEHTKRKLSVSISDIEEQFQLQDFLNKFCGRYRPERPFIYSHCCMNRDLQGLRDQNPRPLSVIDPDTLPIPCYQSTEAIISQVTNPFGNRIPRGYINVASVWI